MTVIDKADDGKLRWDLLPVAEIEELVKVINMGAEKYAPNNWQNMPNATDRLYAALLRHLVDWRKGSKIDQESGLNHLAHVLCNALFLLWFDRNKGGRCNDVQEEVEPKGIYAFVK